MDTTLTRRTFVKGIAASGAALAVAGHASLVPADEAYAAGDSTKTEMVHTVCRACLAQCTVIAHVRDGRVIKLEGDPEGGMSKGCICAKGLAGIQALYNPMRNKYPMVRVGERGENNFKRITWDEALDLIADKIMETREKYGAEAVFLGTGGGGNPHGSGPARFSHAFGTPNLFEPGSSMCYLPRQTATQLVRGPSYVFADLAFYRAMTDAFFPDEGETEAFIVWGGAPMWSQVGQAGQAVAGLLSRENPCKLVVIDPRFIPEASKADVWLPVRPGTDVALMMCWIKYIIDHELFDFEFCQKWTNLPFLVDLETQYCLRADEVIDGAPHSEYVVWDNNSNGPKAMPYPYDESFDAALFGEYEINGVKYKTGYQLLKEACDSFTIEKAAEICWLVPEDIEKAIRIYTDHKSALNHGVATDQNINASAAALSAMVLESIMGNIECPGAMSQRFGELCKNPGICADDTFGLGRLPTLVTEEMLLKRIGADEHKGLHKWDEAHIPSLLNAILTGKPYKPRVWLERSGNKLVHLANAAKWRQAIDEVDFIVHAYMYPTSFTIAGADIILPMREWLEMPRPVLLANKVFARREVTHLFETMDETVLWGKLARKCADRGHETCAMAFDAEAVAPNIPLTETTHDMVESYMDKCELSWDDLLEQSPWEYATFEEWHQYYVYKAPDPETGKPRGFKTPSKLIEAYSEASVLLGRTGRPFSLVRGDNGGTKLVDLPPASRDYHAVPYYLEPEENPLNDTEFPLSMTSGRIPMYHHGTLRNAPWCRELMPTAEIWINPEDAEKYGIEDKHWVLVESRRGKTYARSHVTKGIRPGAVYQERFWNPELIETDNEASWSEQNVNMLSKEDGEYDEMHGSNALRGYQVRVSMTDYVPAGWTEPKQFEPWLPTPSDRTEEV